jgi:molecular chaperone DnaK (HSP70)
MSGVERERARFIVGIDLGTSNTAVAYVALSDSQQIRIFPIEQLVAPGEVAARPLLPSFRYHPAEGELSAADLQLAAAAGVSEPAVIGSLAQTLGGRVIAARRSCRGVRPRASAKSRRSRRAPAISCS